MSGSQCDGCKGNGDDLIACVIIQQVITDHSQGGGHRAPKSTNLPKASKHQCFPMAKVSHVAKAKFKDEKEPLPLIEKSHNIMLQGGMHSGQEEGLAISAIHHS